MSLIYFLEPMRTPKTLKIAEIQARRIAVDWESLGYNITRCHTFNVTICYHYFRGHNESKADCLDMDPKAPQHVVNHLPPYTNVSLKMILTNPEGRKESEETIIQTDEDGMLMLCYLKKESYIIRIKNCLQFSLLYPKLNWILISAKCI